MLAKTKNKNYMGETETGLSLFLVDRQEGGVSVSDPAPVTALSGVGFAQVDFKCKGESTAVSFFGFDGITTCSFLVIFWRFFLDAGFI